MIENDGDKPVKAGSTGDPRSGRDEGTYNVHFEMSSNRRVGPLLGCPIMLLMLVFVFMLTIIAFFLSIFGSRKAAELIMRRVSQLKNSGRSSFDPGDPDVIDVDGEVIDPPHRDKE